MVSPTSARFKAEIHFNPFVLTERYLSTEDNLSAIHSRFDTAAPHILQPLTAPFTTEDSLSAIHSRLPTHSLTSCFQ
jgi:hypothetical protein